MVKFKFYKFEFDLNFTHQNSNLTACKITLKNSKKTHK